VEENTNFDIPSGINWQVVIEFGSLLIELNQQELVDPVKPDVENHSEWIKNGEASREHEDAP
jgi:hypothetical protein